MDLPVPAKLDGDPAPPRAPDLLRHLPNTQEGFQITGEAGELRWPVYLSHAQVEGGLRFRVGYLSAVSVLEDASVLSVKINGRAIGSVAINAPQATKVIDFAIPPGLAVPGYNAVTLDVEQRHRVDCSVVATYELWTRIDPAQTGILVGSATSLSVEIGEFAALLPNSDGTLPIRIVLAAKTNPAQIQRFMAAVQRVAIAGHFLQPSVEFGPFADDPHGLNLVMGTRDTLRALAPIGSASGTSGPLLKMVRMAGSPRPTLLISGSNDDEVDAAIAQIRPPDHAQGSAAGLRFAATYPGLRTPGGERLHLRDFGVDSREFSGRLLRQSFDLMLPADFLPADYARGTFDLAGGYAAGLARGAEVRLDINGRNAGQVKLPSADGDVFRHNPLFLPLTLLRPGLNRIDVLAQTPKPADLTCGAAQAAGGDKRFLLLDSSELTLPTLAHVERLPDVAVTMAGGTPFLSGHPRLFVPRPSRDAMGAALSLVARLGAMAGKALPFTFTVSPPVDDAGATLIVAPAQALDRSVMTDIGLDPEAVETAWRDRARDESLTKPARQRWWATSADGPTACRLPLPRSGAKAPPSTPVAGTVPVASIAPVLGEEDDLFERWSLSVRGATTWGERLVALPGRLHRWAGRQTAALRWPATVKQSDGVGPEASLILAQGFAAATPTYPTTVVTAPDAATLKASIACLTDPQVAAQLGGRMSVLDASTGTVTTTEADHLRYTTAGAVSLGNLRLVAAGWLSLNPLAFVALILLAALCLSGTTLVFVRGVGRRGAK